MVYAMSLEPEKKENPLLSIRFVGGMLKDLDMELHLMPQLAKDVYDTLVPLLDKEGNTAARTGGPRECLLLYFCCIFLLW